MLEGRLDPGLAEVKALEDIRRFLESGRSKADDSLQTEDGGHALMVWNRVRSVSIRLDEGDGDDEARHAEIVGQLSGLHGQRR